MKCPECKTDNPDSRKFCRECGEKLLLICPQCNTENIPGDKFCGECGHNLTKPSEALPKELSFDEKLDKIQRYLPKGLTEKILAQRDRIEGERKYVTVMFCDMVGFTALSERLGPEDAYTIMDQVYEILIHKVHDYEGTVNEMTGDGIMALFGAPIALEDAPQRAIRSAYAIHREMTRFSEKIKQEKNITTPVKMRIGIHTGPVVLGTLGNDLRVEFKAVGDTVNLASRMEDLAEPGTTYVSEETFRLTEGFFRYEALGTKKIKGKEEPVEIYRVITPSSRRTRFDVSAERGLTLFVGRERELELLLDGFERVKTGHGQAFSIVAEAGVGKSRLLYEFRKAVSNENVTFLEGKCLSYSRGITHHLSEDILKANFDIRESDGDSEIRKKVKRGLKILEADEASTLPYFLEILSLKNSGIDKISMSPEAKKDRIIEAFRQITLMGSEIRPLILAYEDLHWVDKSSEDVLKHILESIPGARVLMIFTYRPEFVHTWGSKSYHSQLNLNRLSNRESLAMVYHLLGMVDIDRDLEELIIEKTEGIPFFIEEFIRSLKDLKIIERKDNKYVLGSDIENVTIPSTIQDVIMSRVDSLPEGAKEVLQTGSVIGREFSYELIKRITRLSERELLSRLSIVKDAELLYERGIYPQSSYIFKHALTQEVVYDSILTKRKKNFHEEIGEAIEDLYKQNIDGQYEVLAEHFIKSENYEKGAEYSKLASKKTFEAASIIEAIAYAKKRVVCLEKLPQRKEVQQKIIDARTILGLHYMQINYHIESKEAVEPIISLPLSVSHKRRSSQINIILGTYSYLVEENFPKAFKYLEDALVSSEELNDVVCESLSAYWLGFGLTFNCEHEKSIYYLEKAMGFYVMANIQWAVSMVKTVLSYFVYFFQGNFNLMHQNGEEALLTAEESGDIYSKSLAYSAKGVSYYCKRRFDKARKYLIKGADLGERINHFFSYSLAQFYMGETYHETGELEKSENHYYRAIRLLEKNRSLPFLVKFLKIGLARAKVINNKKDIDLEVLCGYANRNKVKLFDGWMSRYIGEILLHMDENRIYEAEKWTNKALQADTTNGVMFHLGQDYVLYSELLKRKGEPLKAKENLKKAIEIFKECGADGWVEKYEEELSALS